MTRNKIYSLKLVAMCFAMVIGFLGESWAQTSSFQGGRIERILVEGNQRIEPSTVASYLIIQVGDPFAKDIICDRFVCRRNYGPPRQPINYSRC